MEAIPVGMVLLIGQSRCKTRSGNLIMDRFSGHVVPEYTGLNVLVSHYTYDEDGELLEKDISNGSSHFAYRFSESAQILQLQAANSAIRYQWSGKDFTYRVAE